MSIILLTLSWPPLKLGFLVYIGLVPLLFYVDSLDGLTKFSRYLWTFLGVFIVLFLFPFISSYNGWGDYNNNIFMVIIMCFLPMSIIISLFTVFKNKKVGYLFLIFSWGSMEILQMTWEFNSPLLMLGYSLSYYPELIQHYAIWGSLGGAMHIVAINILVYQLIKRALNRESFQKQAVGLGILFIPILLSVIFYVFPSKIDSKERISIVLAHFEHFTEEYALKPMLLIKKYNSLLKGSDVSKSEIIVLPESTIVEGGWIENLNNPNIPNPMDSLFNGKPVLFGSHMFSIYKERKSEIPYNVRYDKNSKVHYNSHNCIVYRSPVNTYSVRSKEKFVSFHEIIPYHSLMSFSKNWFVKSADPAFLSIYQNSSERVFKVNENLKIYSLMCFESFFSNMVIKQPEAGVIFVLANESWNNQDKGKEQYFSYMSTKAIESGKTLVKVSNCGYSGIFNSKGKTLKKIGYAKNGVHSLEIEIKKSASIYSTIASLLHGLVVITPFILVVINTLTKTMNN